MSGPHAQSVAKAESSDRARRPQPTSSRIPSPQSGAVSAAGWGEAAGNLAIQELARTGIIKAKLRISQPNDPEEREAARVAEQIVRGERAAITGRSNGAV